MSKLDSIEIPNSCVDNKDRPKRHRSVVTHHTRRGHSIEVLVICTDINDCSHYSFSTDTLLLINLIEKAADSHRKHYIRLLLKVKIYYRSLPLLILCCPSHKDLDCLWRLMASMLKAIRRSFEANGLSSGWLALGTRQPYVEHRVNNLQSFQYREFRGKSHTYKRFSQISNSVTFTSTCGVEMRRLDYFIYLRYYCVIYHGDFFLKPSSKFLGLDGFQ